MTTPIPSPASVPILGSVGAIDPEFPLGSMKRLADQHGEIYKLHLPLGRSVVVVTTHALVNEVCDERRFKKTINPTLAEVRHGVGSGLFTAHSGEEAWGIAHRVLMPAFGPMSIGAMFDEMHDIASQMALKWARQGPRAPVASSDDFTRLALDTLGLCSMGYRFNSFYHDEMHPFIRAMGDFLSECGRRPRRPPMTGFFYRAQDQKFREDIEVLRSTVRDVLETRRMGEGKERKDLLAAMLDGVDRQTGKKISDENIMDNLVTFAIAGHETTSGMLSFAFYELLKHPEAYRKAQAEVDSVVGDGPITLEHLPKLRYIAAVLRETLRLDSPIPVFSVEPLEDTVLGGGKYAVQKGQSVLLLLARMHVDPAVYGPDASEFLPERMLDEEFDQRGRDFPNSWKPFGNGARACIGRPFAWQEALLVMAMALQNFDFVMHDANYALAIKQTLTIKPNEFYFRAILRHGMTATELERRLVGGAGSRPRSMDLGRAGGEEDGGSRLSPLTVLYGSNSGTCEAFAQRIANDAPSHGFKATTLDCLDSARGRLPSGQPTVIVTASYEGQPPDNAKHFVTWLEGLDKDGTLEGVDYAVFGCGNKDWTSTFHRVPKLVDAALEEKGASRVAETGLGDAAGSQLFNAFEAWEDDVLWPALQKKYAPSSGKKGGGASADVSNPALSVVVSNPRTGTLRQNVKHCVVTATRVLTSPGADAVKKHIEIRLPDDMTYAAGDYLAVLPVNPGETVYRALRRFGLSRDSRLTIDAPDGVATNLPAGEGAVAASEILGSYVELQQLATRKNMAALLAAPSEHASHAALEKLAGDDYDAEIVAKNVSVLDLLERFPDVQLDIGAFLGMMPAMRVRQYSISSSPLASPHTVTLSFALVDAPARSSTGRRHRGVATSYLSSLAAGDVVHAAIRPSPPAFHLPASPDDTPIVCVAAGTGIAPFRAFAQERALMLAAGRSLAPAILFFGCRSPDTDDLYRDELDEWQRQGAIDVRRAYSRHDSPGEQLPKYVQDRLWQDRADALDLWARGAHLYVCGSRSVADGVADVVLRIKKEWEQQNGGIGDDEAREWFDRQRNLRYITDVFD